MIQRHIDYLSLFCLSIQLYAPVHHLPTTFAFSCTCALVQLPRRSRPLSVLLRVASLSLLSPPAIRAATRRLLTGLPFQQDSLSLPKLLAVTRTLRTARPQLWPRPASRARSLGFRARTQPNSGCRSHIKPPPRGRISLHERLENRKKKRHFHPPSRGVRSLNPRSSNHVQPCHGDEPMPDQSKLSNSSLPNSAKTNAGLQRAGFPYIVSRS